MEKIETKEKHKRYISYILVLVILLLCLVCIISIYRNNYTVEQVENIITSVYDNCTFTLEEYKDGTNIYVEDNSYLNMTITVYHTSLSAKTEFEKDKEWLDNSYSIDETTIMGYDPIVCDAWVEYWEHLSGNLIIRIPESSGGDSAIYEDEEGNLYDEYDNLIDDEYLEKERIRQEENKANAENLKNFVLAHFQ